MSTYRNKCGVSRFEQNKIEGGISPELQFCEMDIEAVVSTNLHGLFVDRIIPQTIALYKSITQVRDRSLGFEK